MLIGLVNKLCDIIGSMDTLDYGNPTKLILHYAFSFRIRFYGGFFAYISCIVLAKYCCSLYSSSQLATNLFFIDSMSLNIFFINLAPSDGHIHMHGMD
jgi:hypothetical protein